MNTIITGTLNETRKIFSKKKFVFLFAAALLVTIGASIINLITGSSFGVSLLKSSSLPVTVLNFMASLLIPLFIILLTGDLFSGEASDNSIVMSLVRPITRNKLYVSKILSVGISIMALLMGTFVVTFIASLLGGNMGDILSMLPYNFLSYISAVVPMTLIAVITAFVAQFTRSSSLTVVIMIFASILMSAVSLFVPQIVSMLPTTYLSWYRNFYNGVNFVRVLNEFLYILSYGIIFMFAGTYVFQQKDI